MTNVLILHNEPVLPPDHPEFESENEILFTVDAVDAALAEAGMRTVRCGIHDDPQPLLAMIRQRRPDVIFNLYEGTGVRGQTEAYMAGLLEWMDIPFTGCSSASLSLARHKEQTKFLLSGAGLPTPPFFVVDELPVAKSTLGWPRIVKPARQDASVGIDQSSVVTNARQMERRITQTLREYGAPVLIEEYIPGRELAIAVIDNPEPQPLPISEIKFVREGAGYPIVTYDGKWTPGSPDFECTELWAPDDIDDDTLKYMQTLALDACRLLRCRDFARVDFRLHESGKPFILEVNPNPDYSPLACFADSLENAGWTYGGFTTHLVKQAMRRHKGLNAEHPHVRLYAPSE